MAEWEREEFVWKREDTREINIGTVTLILSNKLLSLSLFYTPSELFQNCDDAARAEAEMIQSKPAREA